MKLKIFSAKSILLYMIIILCFFTTALFLKAQENTSAQAIDKEYTKLIKEATTKPEFLSPLTDYLPQTEGIPTPKDVLGYIAGAPGKLTYYDDIIVYMNSLAEASPHVQVVPIGKTSERREMVIVVVTSENNMEKLSENKKLIAKLADPRIVKTGKEADALVSRIIPSYLLTCNLHSPESGSAEAAMEMAYRLAVDDNPIVKTIRENLIVLIVPSVEPDGHDKHTDWYYKYNQDITDYKKISHVPFWGKYDYHDNNRDMITMSQPEMQNIADVFYEWLPVVVQDNHESVPYLFFSSANGPSSFLPTMDSERNLIAWWEVTQMNAYGMPGVHTHDFGNTSWSPNFMASIASNHNATFHFYETFGNAIANTMEREVSGKRLEKAWYRPIPPYKKVMWSLRNNLNYQITGNLLAEYVVASHKEFFLKNFWKRGFESYTTGKDEPPYAYIIPDKQKDRVDTAFLVNVLLKQQIEVHRAKSEIKVKEGKFPPNSYVVRLDQPYANFVKILLEIQKYPEDALNAYDDCGWTLGLNMGVETVEIKDKAIFDVPVAPVNLPVEAAGEIYGGEAAGAYIINNGTVNNLLTARIRLKGFKVLASEEPFKVKNRDFDAGSLIIPVAGASLGLHKAVESISFGLGLDAYSSKKLPEVKTHDLELPRIAIYHTWSSTQDDGWVRFAFDQLEIPFSMIHKDHIREGNLKNKYDVIVFSNARGRIGADIVNGIDPAHRGSLGFVRSDKFKHLGTPDSCEDITGGMGIKGVYNLQKFVEEGGLLIALQNSIRVPIEYGMIRGIRYYEPSSKFYNPGSLLKSEVVNSKHPAVYGYDKEIAILRRHSGPLLKVPEEMEKYVVVRYAKEGEVCLSGIVKNDNELNGKAAIIDVPSGQGHILLFTFNPFWRDTNHNAYMFVFNSILNYNDLDTGLKH